jgi:hypothetical protein
MVEQETGSWPPQQREEHWQRLHDLQQQHLQEQRQQSHAQARARRASAPDDLSMCMNNNNNSSSSSNCAQPVSGVTFSPLRQSRFAVMPAAGTNMDAAAEASAQHPEPSDVDAPQEQTPASQQRSRPSSLLAAALDILVECDMDSQGWSLQSEAGLTCAAAAAAQQPTGQAQPDRLQVLSMSASTSSAQAAEEPAAAGEGQPRGQQDSDSTSEANGASKPSWVICTLQRKASAPANKQEHAESADTSQPEAQVQGRCKARPSSPLSPRLAWLRPKKQQLQLEEALSGLEEEQQEVPRPLSPTSRRLGWLRQKQHQQQQQQQQLEEASAAEEDQPCTHVHHMSQPKPSSLPCPKFNGADKVQLREQLQPQQQQQEALSTDQGQTEAQLQDRPRSPKSSPSSPRLGWFRKKQHTQLDHLHQLQEALLVQHLEQQQLEQQKQQQAVQIEKLQAALMLQQGQHRKRLDEVRAQGQTEMQLLLKETQEARRQDHEKVKQLQWLLLEQQDSVQHDLLQEYEQRQKAMKSREAELEQQHKELQHQLDVQLEQNQVLEARAEVLQLKAEQACEEVHGLQEHLARSQAENAELQVSVLNAAVSSHHTSASQCHFDWCFRETVCPHSPGKSVWRLIFYLPK